MTVSELAPGEYHYIQSESWDITVAVSNNAAQTSVVPTLREIWSSPSGPKLKVERAAAPIAPGTLTPMEESRARQAVTSGAAHREGLSRAVVGPFGTLTRLPQDPQALFTRLADPIGDEPADPSDPIAVGHAMNGLRDYLTYSVPTPAFLGALYAMLRVIPGVSDAGWVTDRAGRRGVAIAVPMGGPSYRHSLRLIADPQSGRLLDLEDIQLDPSGIQARTPFVYSYDVYLRQRTVSRLGSRPPASANPETGG